MGENTAAAEILWSSDSDWGRLRAGPQPGSASWRSTGGLSRTASGELDGLWSLPLKWFCLALFDHRIVEWLGL